MWFRARGRDFNDFAFNAQNVARTRGSGPGEFSTQTYYAVREWQPASNEQPHGHGRGVPTARSQSFEEAYLRGSFVEMERLRIKLGGELFDSRRFHQISPRRESLANAQILQIPLSSGLMRLLHRILHFSIAWHPLRFYWDFLVGDLGIHNSINDALDLCEAAIDEQFRSRDVAAVVGCEKHHGLRDLIRSTEPAEWNTAGNDLHVFLDCFYGMPWGCVGITRAHRVHANAASLQVRCPCARERTHRGFGGAIHAPLGRGRFTGGGGRIQDDRGTIRQQRQCLLYREKQAFHIAVEERVVMLLSDLAQGGKLRSTGIGEHNIELALLPLDLGKEAIEI